VKLDGCGCFELAGDLSDIADITHIDLSGIETLEGNSIDGSTNLFLRSFYMDQITSTFLILNLLLLDR